jgi:S1-C subfamily serine protease
MTNPALAWSTALAAAVDVAAPSVVRVDARRGPGTTGIAWSADLVVTSAAGIERDDRIAVVLAAGDRRDAELVGHDPGTDVALLRVAAGGLPPLRFREADGLKVGEAALALGRPGRSIRASLRIVGVVAPELRTPAGGLLAPFVETDRRIPTGFSGGPLIDLDGAAIGMNTRGLLRGADVAVTAPTLRRVIDELVAHGAVRRGWLGVGAYRVRLPAGIAGQLGRDHGALVVAVEDGSPAAAGGLHLGDVIVDLGGDPVTDPDDLRAALADRADAQVTAKVLRAGQLVDLTLAVGRRGGR